VEQVAAESALRSRQEITFTTTYAISPLTPLRGEGELGGDFLAMPGDATRFKGSMSELRFGRVLNEPHFLYNGLAKGEATSPLGMTDSQRFPKVASLARQPWALGRNPFGIGRTKRREENFRSGSWSKCMRKTERRLSLNRRAEFTRRRGERGEKNKKSELLNCLRLLTAKREPIGPTQTIPRQGAGACILHV
jgi:hypothetical protein